MLTAELLSEVTDGVHRLKLPIPWEDHFVNVYLFSHDGAVDLLDCGMNAAESVGTIREAVDRVGGAGAHLRKLVVTHIHPDHYGAAGMLVNDLGAQLYLHRLEVPMVHPRYLDLEQLVADVGRWLLVNGVPDEEATEISNASRYLRDFVTPGGTAVQLDGAEMLHMGRHRLRVEWTPGHSPGHICLFAPGSKLLFAGDQLLPHISPNIGLHPQSTPNPLRDYMDSLRNLVALDPALVLPGHGEEFSGAVSRSLDLIEHHSRRMERVLEIVRGSEMTAWEVALGLWGPRESLYDKRLALQEALAHLQALAVDRRLEKLATADSVSWKV